jgi:hypothetical protein
VVHVRDEFLPPLRFHIRQRHQVQRPRQVIGLGEPVDNRLIGGQRLGGAADLLVAVTLHKKNLRRQFRVIEISKAFFGQREGLFVFSEGGQGPHELIIFVRRAVPRAALLLDHGHELVDAVHLHPRFNDQMANAFLHGGPKVGLHEGLQPVQDVLIFFAAKVRAGHAEF